LSRSSYDYHRQKLTRADAKCDRFKRKVRSSHSESRGVVGARTISVELQQTAEQQAAEQQTGEETGCFMAARLLNEAGLASK
jgi:hypothetical protein